ncbi:MAG: PAS domain-containing protein [Psychromonas sp.]
MNKFSNSQILLLCGFLSSVFFVFDAAIPLGVAGGFSYIFVIIISLFSHQRNLIILVAIVASILTIIGVFISPLGGEFWPVFLNRCFTLLAIWSTALLGIKLKKIMSEKKLKEDEFHKIFELSPDIIGKGTIGGKFSEINSAVIKTLGYKKEAFLSTPFIDFVHKDDVAGTLSALEDAVKKKRNIIFNNRCRCSAGYYKWFEWNVLATSENNTFYTVVRDITERVFSERNANLSNKRLAGEKKTAHSKQINRINSSNTDSINGSPVIDNHNNNNNDNNKVIEGYNEITISQWSPEMTIDDD